MQHQVQCDRCGGEAGEPQWMMNQRLMFDIANQTVAIVKRWVGRVQWNIHEMVQGREGWTKVVNNGDEGSTNGQKKYMLSKELKGVDGANLIRMIYGMIKSFIDQHIWSMQLEHTSNIPTLKLTINEYRYMTIHTKGGYLVIEEVSEP